MIHEEFEGHMRASEEHLGHSLKLIDHKFRLILLAIWCAFNTAMIIRGVSQ